MPSFFNLKTSLTLAAILAMSAAQAATISKDEYEAGKTRVSAEYKVDKAACASLAGNTKDICVEEAKGKEKVANAELKFAYSAKPADHTSVLEAKANAAYDVAKEKCDDKAGNDKSVCVKEAKAAKVKALADARTSKQVSEAKMEGAEDKRDADYKVAAQKCEVLAGDAKTGCISAAKTTYGKN